MNLIDNLIAYTTHTRPLLLSVLSATWKILDASSIYMFTSIMTYRALTQTQTVLMVVHKLLPKQAIFMVDLVSPWMKSEPFVLHVVTELKRLNVPGVKGKF